MTSNKLLNRFALFFVLYEVTTYLSNDMIMPAMLQIEQQFNAPATKTLLALSYYLLGGSLLQIFLGPLTEKFGKRKIMLIGCIFFFIMTLLIIFSQSIDQFLLLRFFQGMGVCFIFIGYAVIHESSSDVQAVKLTAILANVAIFAPLIGPLVGSIIANIFNWQTIFVFTAVLDIVAFIGLFMYTPTKDKKTTISIKQIIKTYWRIVSNKAFMFGIFVAGLTIIPLTGWIGLSPIMIMKTINLPYSYYISYQVIIFTGFILSNFLLQKIAGRFSFTQLIKYGSVIALIGMLSAAVFYNHITIFILAMFIYAFGYGIFNSTVLRFAISSTGESSSLTTACMSLLYCTYISLGLQFYNIMGNKFGYSIMTYAMINLGIGIVSFILLLIFAHKFVKTFGK